MTEESDKKTKTKETVAKRLERLGFKREPGWTVPKNRFYLARRIQRESDENWFNKPNPGKTDDKE